MTTSYAWSEQWASPRGVEGSPTNSNTPGGYHGREAKPATVHDGVQGTGGQAAVGWRQGAVGGGDRAGLEHGPAEHLARRAPGGWAGRGAGPADGPASGNRGAGA